MKAFIASSLIALAALGAASVQAASEHMGHDMSAHSSASAEMQMVDGLVKKVDKAGGKVTLSHGPLTNLNMPGMTMAFRVKESDWLDQMKVGDKIRFMADSVNGAITLVHFEPVK